MEYGGLVCFKTVRRRLSAETQKTMTEIKYSKRDS
jgi:hypothetical protein